MNTSRLYIELKEISLFPGVPLKGKSVLSIIMTPAELAISVMLTIKAGMMREVQPM
jgi:hypothetical protein